MPNIKNLNLDQIFAFHMGQFIATDRYITPTILSNPNDLNQMFLSPHLTSKYNSNVYITRFSCRSYLQKTSILPNLDSLLSSLALYHKYNLKTLSLDDIYYFLLVTYHSKMLRVYLPTLLLLRIEDLSFYCGTPRHVNLLHLLPFKSIQDCIYDYNQMSCKPTYGANPRQTELFPL